MMNLWPGDADSYFRMVRDEGAREARDAADRERALTDPALQCGHGVSLYRTCDACGNEATDAQD